MHIDRAHTRLAACDALYETQAPTTPTCKALTCCPARHCLAAPNQEHAAWRRELTGMPGGQPEWTETIHAVCFECNHGHQTCDVAYPHQCLMAQGWCKPAKNWYCAVCSEGWWRPPAGGLVTCKHKQDPLDRMATMAGFSGRAVGSAHEEINRSSSWPPEDRRIGAVEATNEAPATLATRLVG